MKFLGNHLTYEMHEDLRIAGYVAVGLVITLALLVGVGVVFSMVIRTLSHITEEEWEAMQKKDI